MECPIDTNDNKSMIVRLQRSRGGEEKVNSAGGGQSWTVFTFFQSQRTVMSLSPPLLDDSCRPCKNPGEPMILSCIGVLP